MGAHAIWHFLGMWSCTQCPPNGHRHIFKYKQTHWCPHTYRQH